MQMHLLANKKKFQEMFSMYKIDYCMPVYVFDLEYLTFLIDEENTSHIEHYKVSHNIQRFLNNAYTFEGKKVGHKTLSC